MSALTDDCFEKTTKIEVTLSETGLGRINVHVPKFDKKHHTISVGDIHRYRYNFGDCNIFEGE